MLSTPTVGFSRSVTAHNVELDAVCDWIEGSILFDGDELSKSDVVDILCESQIYSAQSMAWEIVDDVWRELKRRVGWLGAGSPFSLTASRVSRAKDWADVPAHSFCLCLSFARFYPKWAASFGKDYTVQGELFEALTAKSLETHFPEWHIHPTGWTRSKAQKLSKVVTEVADLLGEATGKVERWTSASANEAGLDIVCYRSFKDARPCAPVLLFQCASGKHYAGKLHTPSLDIWTKIVDFTQPPIKAFSTPFAIMEDEFRRVALLVRGVLLDRYRLLAPARTDPNWSKTPLGVDIIAWATPRIAALPRMDT